MRGLREIRGAATTFVAVLAAALPVHAQSVLDRLLPGGGTEDLVGTQPGPVYTVDESMGEARGGNLFHGFRRFSIASGDTAHFTSVQPFDRVLVRVTGGETSSIDGTLRSTVLNGAGGGADFFFLNPAGVLFGPNAAVDLSGSLFLSTSDALTFDNGDVLEIADETTPVLSVAAPRAFGFFGGAPAGDVLLAPGGSIALDRGERLALVGGDVRVNGPLSLGLSGVNVGFAAAGSAAAEVDVATLDVTTATPSALGEVAIGPGVSLVALDLTDLDGEQGRFVVRGGRLLITGSGAEPTELVFGGTPGGTEPAIDVDVSGEVAIEGFASLATLALGSQVGGGMRIAADALNVDVDGAVVGLGSDGSGAGGARPIRIDARDVRFDGGTGLFSIASGPGGGADVEILADTTTVTEGGQVLTTSFSSVTGPRILIQGGELVVQDGGAIEASTQGAGAGGRIDVDVDRLELGRTDALQTPGFLSTSSAAGSTGTGGDIEVLAREVSLASGAQISTTTQGGSDAGAIRLVVDETVRLEGDDGGTPVNQSGFFTRATAGSGNGGDIDVVAERIEIVDGALVSALSESPGDAGSIRLEARDEIRVEGEGALPSSIQARAEVGGAGDITLVAPRVRITDGGAVSANSLGGQPVGRIRIEGGDLLVTGSTASGTQVSTISANTQGTGTAGGIEVDVTGDVVVSDDAQLTTLSESSAPSGSITVSARSVRVSSGGRLSTVAEGSADAGVIEIDVADTLEITDGRLTSNARLGAGGRITARAGERIRLGDGAEIATEVALGAGDAGDIELSAPVLTLDRATVTATAVDGLGGDVRIDAGLLFESAESTIDATSETNFDGEVSRATPQVDLSGQLGRLDSRPTEASDGLTRDCSTRSEVVGSLVVEAQRREERFDADDLDFLPGDGAAPEREGDDACAR